jgi:Icc-related predicted phosphoesterase
MKIAHISDTHGHLAPIMGSPDVIVHSGDFLPNQTFGMEVIERAFQPKWLEFNETRLKEWIDGRPFLISHGNHDFINSVPYLQAMGIEAYDLDDVRLEFDGLIFHGFPWVPEFGPWNRGCNKRELQARTDALDLEGVDILVTHSPPYGILDRNARGERCGGKPMREKLQMGAHVPSYVMSGHIHESAGVQGWSRGVIISNAACVQNDFLIK